MRVSRLYTGSDNQSHFEDIEIAMLPRGDSLQTEVLPAVGVRLTESPADRDMDFHPAPRRQLVITISGRTEMEIGDGTKRQFSPGDIFLADDLTGQGHITRNLGMTRESVIIHLDPSFDLDALRQ